MNESIVASANNYNVVFRSGEPSLDEVTGLPFYYFLVNKEYGVDEMRSTNLPGALYALLQAEAALVDARDKIEYMYKVKSATLSAVH